LQENKYDLVIATTATTRPLLHDSTFKKYCSFLQGLNCLWLVGIDYLNTGLSCPTPEATKVNIENILNEHPNISHRVTVNLKNNGDYRGGTRSAFYRNALELTNECVRLSHQTNHGILWLEDDWEVITPLKLKDILSEYKVERGDYLQLVLRPLHRPDPKKKVVTYNPGLFGQQLFKDLCHAGINRKNTRWFREVRNPEAAATWRNESHALYEKVNGPPVTPKRHHVIDAFRDVGRKWQDSTIRKRTFLLQENK